jgi:AcrR family transcriptional regulator
MRRALLETAVDLVVRDGPEALTVKRLAEEFGSSVGMIYRLFDSKDALVAAIRAARFSALATAADEHAKLAASEQDEGAAPLGALAAVIRAGRFWIDAGRRAPREVDALRHALADPAVDVAERSVVADTVLRPLVTALDEARDAGALGSGGGRPRAAMLVIVLAVTAPTLDLGGDPSLTPHLGEQLLLTLLGGWGAAPEALAGAVDLLRR